MFEPCLAFIPPFQFSDREQAIFAIPETHNVVFSPMGRGWFVGAIFIMFFGTAIIAYFIVPLIGWMKPYHHRLKDFVLGWKRREKISCRNFISCKLYFLEVLFSLSIA